MCKGGEGEGERKKGGKKVQTSSYDISPGDVQHGDYS